MQSDTTAVVQERNPDVDRILSAIEKQGLKKYHVAKQIGISEIYMTFILTGRRNLTEPIRAKLFNYLNIR